MTMWTYFAKFKPGYIKAGKSISPADRNFGPSMRPADVDLESCEFIGCLPMAEFSEAEAHDLLAPFSVRGCKEWFYTTDEALMSIANLRLVATPPRRINKRVSPVSGKRMYELSESARQQRRDAATERWKRMSPASRTEALRPAFSITPGRPKGPRAKSIANAAAIPNT